ncbi:hypothetical protein [Ensifer sp. BR816]|uniref:hypothetical protein n=1 Tax=Rhizobium sp. (strain BR816) TaxID=1057002 RepID=UPI0003778C1B|nr:hypothetical protein [Ensifer sp. BR816]
MERHSSTEGPRGSITTFLVRLPGGFAGVLAIFACCQQSTDVRADEPVKATLNSPDVPTFSWNFGARWDDIDTPDLFSHVALLGTPQSGPDPPDTVGIRSAFSFRLPLEDAGFGPFFLELNGAVSHASGTSWNIARPIGNSFDLAAGDPAGGSISLATATDPMGATAAGTIHFTDSSGDSASIIALAHSPAGSGNAVTQYATSGTHTGAAFLALVTGGGTPSAAAYAAFADDRGLFFQALGEVDGSVAASTLEQRSSQFDQTLLLGTSLDLGNGWTITPRLGPTYRSTRRDTVLRTEVDIDESVASGAVIPAIGYHEKVELSADYYGVVSGFSAERSVAENVWLQFNVSAGVAHYRARLDNRATAVFPDAGVTLSSSEQRRSGGTFLADISAAVIFSSQESLSVKFEAGTGFLADVPIYRTGTLGTDETQSYYLAVGLQHRF